MPDFYEFERDCCRNPYHTALNLTGAINKVQETQENNGALRRPKETQRS